MSKPPQMRKQKNGKWYVCFRDGRRSKAISLRTRNQEIATLRVSGWLKEHKLQTEVVEDPTVEFCLDLWFNQWIAGQMLSEARYHSIINNLNAYFGKMPLSHIRRDHATKYIELRSNGVIGSKKAASGTAKRYLFTALRNVGSRRS